MEASYVADGAEAVEEGEDDDLKAWRTMALWFAPPRTGEGKDEGVILSPRLLLITRTGLGVTTS